MQYNTYFNLKSNSDKNNLREGRKALFLAALHTSNCVCGNHRKQEFWKKNTVHYCSFLISFSFQRLHSFYISSLFFVMAKNFMCNFVLPIFHFNEQWYKNIDASFCYIFAILTFLNTNNFDLK